MFRSNKAKKLIHAAKHMSYLKSLYYSIKFKGIVIVGRGSAVHVARRAKLEIAKGAFLTVGIEFTLPSRSILEIEEGGKVVILGPVHFARGSRVSVGADARLEVGAWTFINEGSVIVCRKEIIIGDHCAIGWNCNILDSDLHTIIRDGKEGRRESPVRLGNGVWMGLNVTILKGVTIGDRAVIAAGSLVTKNIPSKALAGGNPIRVIDENVDWKD